MWVRDISGVMLCASSVLLQRSSQSMQGDQGAHNKNTARQNKKKKLKYN